VITMGDSPARPITGRCSVELYDSYAQAIERGPIEKLCVIGGAGPDNWPATASVESVANKYKSKACDCGATDAYIASTQKTGSALGGKYLGVTLVAFRFKPTKVDVSPVTPGSARSHAVLGVRMTALAAKAFGSDGARVAEVAPRSAAAEAGIMQGDILLQVGDRDINDPHDVQTALSAVTPGAIVAIKLLRNARFIWVNVQF
jgi:PDZ domain